MKRMLTAVVSRWWVLCAVVAFAGVAWAQEAAAYGDASEFERSVLLTISGVAPLLIALLKRWLPAEASPYIAPAIGALAAVLVNYFSGIAVDPALGTMAGAAGVGWREAVDQAKKAAHIRD